MVSQPDWMMFHLYQIKLTYMTKTAKPSETLLIFFYDQDLQHVQDIKLSLWMALSNFPDLSHISPTSATIVQNAEYSVSFVSVPGNFYGNYSGFHTAT